MNDSDMTDSSIAPYILGRPISQEPASEEEFQLIEDWVQECEEHHPQCNKDETALPTRLIDVGSSDGLRKPHLFIPEDGLKSRYLVSEIPTKRNMSTPYPTLAACFSPRLYSTTLTCIQHLHIHMLTSFRHFLIAGVDPMPAMP
jgi:hypothetical protein